MVSPLVLSASLPAIVISVGALGMIVSKMSSRGQKLVLNLGNVVSQTIGSIRTVLSYTREKQVTDNYNSKLKRSLGHAAWCLDALAAGQAAAYKMFETVNRQPKIDSSNASGIVSEDIRGDMGLEDVHFRYPTRPDIQISSGFTLHIQCGNSVALVGHSGSGKSKVISLVERFYDPDFGDMLITC